MPRGPNEQSETVEDEYTELSKQAEFRECTELSE